MKKVYKRTLTSKLYMLLGLCWIWISMSSCLFNYYSPSTDLSFSGTSTYCKNAIASPVNYTYDQCTLGGGIFNSGVSATVQWYYNTTGGTTIATSTALGFPTGFSTPSSGPGSLSFTPVTTTAGTFYYFAYITWSTSGTCTPDYTSGTFTVVINPPSATISGPASSVCIGNTIPLTASAPGGTWSSSTPANATVAAGVVTGVAAGTAVISYGLAGCFDLDTITVLATPTTINPTTAVSFCQATTTTLTVTPAGGTWSTSTPAVATVSPAGVVSGISGGTATISYTLSTGCYRTKTVNVIPVPGPIGGSFIGCPGFNSVLTNSATGGVWTSSNTSVATIGASTGILTGLTTGTTTITYTGCGFTTAVITVNPNPSPIAGPSNVCAGGATIALSDPTPGGTWSSASPGIATAFTAGSGIGVVTGLVAGTATITYTSPLSCYALLTVNVTPLPGPIGGIIPLCAGQTMTLSNSVPGGLWYSSVPGVATVDPFTGVVTGVLGGSTTISYTTSCGTATAVVNVSSLPTPITGRDTVCVGAFTTLANATIGGTWSSSNPAVASVLTGSGIVTGNAVGTTYISYIMPGGCYTTDLVTTFLYPSTISGTAQVCPGSTTILTNTVTGGTWISTNPATATIGSSSGVVTGLSAGTASITYVVPEGCYALTVVTVNPIPEMITGTLTLCATDKDTLSDLSAGGVWSSLTPGTGTIDPTTGIVTTLAVSGTSIVTIKYTLPTGCFTTRSFTVNPLPGPAVTFNAAINTFYTTTGFASYQWYNSVQGPIPGATTYRTAGLVNGTYWVVVTDESTGCTAASSPVTYNVSMGAGNAAGNSDPRVYPNPSKELVYIESPVRVRAVISGVDGKKLIDQDNAKKIDISNLSSGVYFITIYDENGTQLKVQKLVKE